jgi:hypothetical protein
MITVLAQIGDDGAQFGHQSVGADRGGIGWCVKAAAKRGRTVAHRG